MVLFTRSGTQSVNLSPLLLQGIPTEMEGKAENIAGHTDHAKPFNASWKATQERTNDESEEERWGGSTI